MRPRSRPAHEEYNEKFANPFIAAHRGFIDDVIMPHGPAAHRPRAGDARTRGSRPWRKHGNIPL